jgi:hypothetical protein
LNATLDILTPKGRQSLADQIRAMEIVFANSDKGHEFIHTGGEGAARVDGMIVRDKRIKHVAEVKSREMTLEQLRGPFHNEWLVTMDKILDLCNTARVFDVSGWGFLYCKPTGVVLAIQLCDQHGRLLCRYRTARTTTQASVNGGLANRVNAFIRMDKALEYWEHA